MSDAREPGTPTGAPRPIDDVRALRAMAHPLRVRLYYALSAESPSTASRLAARVGESPALVSYHLRQLAAHDFIEHAPPSDDGDAGPVATAATTPTAHTAPTGDTGDTGDRAATIRSGPGRDHRERWWRPTSRGFTYSPASATSPEARTAARSLQAVALDNQVTRLTDFLDHPDDWSTDWRRAAFSSDTLLRLTAPELDEFSTELHELLARWAERGRGVDEPTRASSESDPREHVMVFAHGFPVVP
ncbi:helix-turn-helix domain-containing protein [Frigoribacterium faeni]|uniref:Transcriptional regulator n=1 Tax=Frigoribacterium faeni TaxID=145483 RepID=A0A7W3JJ25_9MICO|nr:helix-turn-helix domain-containing protein [Frigoribacterium faeni]MBA8813782.1 hypothetical protein [Frigoribacterium faeni]GEK84315.1 transcriptional regulator [Frigoribacterium faeni]